VPWLRFAPSRSMAVDRVQAGRPILTCHTDKLGRASVRSTIHLQIKPPRNLEKKFKNTTAPSFNVCVEKVHRAVQVQERVLRLIIDDGLRLKGGRWMYDR